MRSSLAEAKATLARLADAGHIPRTAVQPFLDSPQDAAPSGLRLRIGASRIAPPTDAEAAEIAQASAARRAVKPIEKEKDGDFRSSLAKKHLAEVAAADPSLAEIINACPFAKR